MKNNFDQLSNELLYCQNTEERQVLLQGMAKIGSFDQLSNELLYCQNIEERQVLLQGMAKIGSFDQLSNELLYCQNTEERQVLLQGMAKQPQQQTAKAKSATTQNNVRLRSFSGHIKKTSIKQYDVFIAHASEDKDFAKPLAKSLQQNGFEVWYDDFVLKLGDSLQREIDKGLAQSRYGVVILSHNFFNKLWPQKELDGLAAKESLGRNIILPIWRNITKEEVASYSPTLAGIKAAPSRMGIVAITKMIADVIST